MASYGHPTIVSVTISARILGKKVKNEDINTAFEIFTIFTVILRIIL